MLFNSKIEENIILHEKKRNINAVYMRRLILNPHMFVFFHEFTDQCMLLYLSFETHTFHIHTFSLT